MSEQKNQISMTYEDLQSLVTTAVKAAVEAQSQNTTALADAIRDSKKPYVDPRNKANDEAMRKSMIASKKQEKESTEFYQNKVCPHTMGSSPNSARALPDSSFAIHVLDTGEVIGVCTNCTKVISSLKQEDLQHFAKKGGNIRSAAGQRFFSNPLKAQQARHGLDQEEIFVETPEEVPAE